MRDLTPDEIDHFLLGMAFARHDVGDYMSVRRWYVFGRDNLDPFIRIDVRCRSQGPFSFEYAVNGRNGASEKVRTFRELYDLLLDEKLLIHPADYRDIIGYYILRSIDDHVDEECDEINDLIEALEPRTDVDWRTS